MKPQITLRLVPQPSARPLGLLSRAEKLAHAKAFLEERNRYILTRGSKRPSWGIPGEGEKKPMAVSYRGVPTFIERVAEGIKTLWRGQ